MKNSAAAAYRRLAESSEHGGDILESSYTSSARDSIGDGDVELTIPTAGNFSIEDEDLDDDSIEEDLEHQRGTRLSPMGMSTSVQSEQSKSKTRKQVQKLFICFCTLFSCGLVAIVVTSLAYLLIASGYSINDLFPHNPSEDINEVDMYILSLFWMPEICRINQRNAEISSTETMMKQQFPNCNHPHPAWRSNFTLHGLWPEYSSGGYPAYCPNNTFNDYDFDINQLLHSITLDELILYWPSPDPYNIMNQMISDNNNSYINDSYNDRRCNEKYSEYDSLNITCIIEYNQRIWAHEWQKHGSCSVLTMTSYFEIALQLRQEVDTSKMLSSSISTSISTSISSSNGTSISSGISTSISSGISSSSGSDEGDAGAADDNILISSLMINSEDIRKELNADNIMNSVILLCDEYILQENDNINNQSSLSQHPIIYRLIQTYICYAVSIIDGQVLKQTSCSDYVLQQETCPRNHTILLTTFPLNSF